MAKARADVLVQSTKPTGGEAEISVSATAGMTGARLAAFGRAERHSRVVRKLKFLLPLAAVLMVGGFAVYGYVLRPANISVQVDGSAFSKDKLVMANPKLEGFTKAGRPYTMTAMRAVQNVDEQGTIDLEGILAKLPVEADNWVKIDAKNGVYDRNANTLDLTSEILVTTTDGMVAKLNSAFLDIGKGSLETKQPVDIQINESNITANSMRMFDNGKRIVFDKRVRMNIIPSETKAAKPASGGTDASN